MLRVIRSAFFLIVLISFAPHCVADEIHNAAANGDVVTLRKMLKENPTAVNQRDGEGKTALLWAAIRGQLDAARILLDSGADVNLQQNDGWAPLHASVCDGNDSAHLDIARLLLAKGATVDIRRNDGWTPFLAAALKGNVEGMKLLLANGASSKSEDVKGSLPLHFAAYGGQPASIRFLLERGADRMSRNKDGNTALDIALGGSRIDVLDALIPAMNVRFENMNTEEALRRLFASAGVKYVIDDTIDNAVSIEVDGLTFRDALDAVLRSAGRTHKYEIRGGAVHILRAQENSSIRLAAPVSDGRNYRFDKAISREVLNNYLSRAVTHYGLCSTSPEPASAYFEDDLRMLTILGTKFVGRAAYAWVPPADDEAHFQLAKERANRVHAVDSDIVLEACVFEAVYEGVERIPIPDWVFAEFGLPVQKRNFRYASMLYDGGKFKNHWTQGASIPDMSKLETRMYFYYRARRYIDSGFEAIHFGQIHLMDQNDAGHAYWLDMLTRVRKYAARNARRHMVLCGAHTHGVVLDGNRLLFDLHAWPQRPKEDTSSAMKAVLQAGYGDSIYGLSSGGITPSGWRCDSLPYLVEFDAFGASGKEGKPGARFPWVWGYDEAGWFTHAPDGISKEYLSYARNWVSVRHEDGWLQMPTRLNLAVPKDDQRLWHANIRSPSCPVGFGMENTIRAVWGSEEKDRPLKSGR